MARQTQRDIFAATARTLTEQGYDVIAEPGSSLLPAPLHHIVLDGIAIGRQPKLAIAIVGGGKSDAGRVASLQMALKSSNEWKLHLVVSTVETEPEPPRMTARDIQSFVDALSAQNGIDARAGLLMAWAALEALSRERYPEIFSRPQSAGRIVEHLASEGDITPSEAQFLRGMAAKRNAFVHGDLGMKVEADELRQFIAIQQNLLSLQTSIFF